jgi:hypothetical protein
LIARQNTQAITFLIAPSIVQVEEAGDYVAIVYQQWQPTL